MPDIELNDLFRRALDVMENSGRNVFITGKAGTGKSTLLEYFRNTTQKRIAVVAPTGVAALNVGGQTLHSFCRFKPDITLDKVKKVSGERADLYKKLDAVVVDEVSMVRADVMDCAEKFLRLNGPDRKRLFGGIQMIFIGDLYQLPPVVTSREKEAFRLRYETPYFFSSGAFGHKDFDMEFIELEKIYRQTEADFIALLNAIRNRSVTDEDLARLNERFDPEFTPAEDEFYIHLTSTNDLAFARNCEKLRTLGGKTYRYQAMVDGEFERSQLPTDEHLELKIGAQVMLVNNDRHGRWVNGTIGRIADVEPRTNADDLLMIELRDGATVDVAPYAWELFEYRYDAKSKTIATETMGSFLQYPVKLAWAVTIHKSQGKTFNKVIIDIGRGAFAHGQVYVALSRSTNFKGIVLKKEIRKEHIWMDWNVVRFLTRFQYKKADESMSLEEKKRLIRRAIKNGGEIDIVYLKPDDTKSRRRILPEAIEKMVYKGKEFEGLRAWCHLRGDKRHFRIDRILEIGRVVAASRKKQKDEASRP